MALVAALLAVAGVPAPAGAQLTGFSDVSGHWAEAWVQAVFLAGIVTVPEDLRFRPDEPVTRLDLAVWTAKAMELLPVPPDPGAPAPFRDWDQVPEAERGHVLAAVRGGLLKGYPDGTFGPARSITRAELGTIFGRALVSLGVKPEARFLMVFGDAAEIPAWAEPASAAVKARVILGRPGPGAALFAPRATSSRAEAVVMLTRFLEARAQLVPLGLARIVPIPRSRTVVLGYFVNTDAAYQELLVRGRGVNVLVYTSYVIAADGALVGFDSPRTLRWATENRRPLLVMFGNHDQATNRAFLNNPAAVDRAVSAMVELMKRGYSGVNLDFENVDPADRDAYTAFAGKVWAALQPRGYLVTLSVPARTAQTAVSSWGRAYDYRALGQVSHYVTVMTYDQHYPTGPPGPIGSLAWADEVVRYAVSQMDPRKVLLGVPAYGYDWPTTADGTRSAGRARSIAPADAVRLAAERGARPEYQPVHAETTFRYVAGDGTPRVVWFTDHVGLQAKLGLVSRYGLGGVAMWRMGLEPVEYWARFEEAFGRIAE